MTASTRFEPNALKTLASDDNHCLRCFSFLNAAECVALHLLGGGLECRNWSSLLRPFGKRITTGACDLPQPTSLLARFGKRYKRNAAEPDVAPLALDDRPEKPTLRPVWRDKQVEATTISDSLYASRRLPFLHSLCAERIVRMASRQVR